LNFNRAVFQQPVRRHTSGITCVLKYTYRLRDLYLFTCIHQFLGPALQIVFLVAVVYLFTQQLEYGGALASLDCP
jgi:hypothetical protein